jgi:hypothetical protein
MSLFFRMPPKSQRVHFTADYHDAKAACSAVAFRPRLTVLPLRVTCRRCLRIIEAEKKGVQQ